MTSPPLSPPPGVEPVEVHWGTVGHEPPARPAPPREGRRRRLGVLVAVAVTALAVALGGGLALVQEDRGAETVARQYVGALQRLDCGDMARLGTGRFGVATQCRFMRYRSARGDDVRRQLRESRFRLAGVRESGRDATARFVVTFDDGAGFGAGTAQMFVRMQRDEDAEWRVLSSSFVQSGR